MNERERIIVTALFVLLIFSWLGFVVHVSPRFAGSLIGGMFGVAGALLILFPLLYLVIKRVPPLKRAVTRRVPMGTLLRWHVYAGIIGPILALIHTGHKFQSPLGMSLTAMMLVVVTSGFIGRYLLSYISQSLKEKQATLNQLQQQYHLAALELQSQPDEASLLNIFSGFISRPILQLVTPSRYGVSTTLPLPARVLRLSESMADLEYAIRTHELFRSAFRRWLKIHIFISFILYGLLTAHIVSGLYFGLRWFD